MDAQPPICLLCFLFLTVPHVSSNVGAISCQHYQYVDRNVRIYREYHLRSLEYPVILFFSPKTYRKSDKSVLMRAIRHRQWR